MEKQKKSIGAIVLVILLLIATIVSLILATYAWAKYTSTQSGSATAEVAKWNVSFNEGKNSFTGHYNHVVDGKIAPGTEGEFTITPTASSTEVCFDYTIKIDNVQLLNGTTVLGNDDVLADGVTVAQVLSHIQFKSGSTVLSNGAAGTGELTGTYNLGTTNHNSTTGTSSDPTSHTITWVWPYQLTTEGATAEEKAAYDKIDTAAGKFAAGTTGEGENAKANDLKLKVNYTITAVQVNPKTGHANN